jgi:hypothetical protein
MSAALAGLVILVLGDSHMVTRDSLLTYLHDGLAAHGAVVHSFGMCGAAAGDWMSSSMIACGRGEHHDKAPPVLVKGQPVPTWNINALIDQVHPNLVVVESADAMAAYGQAELPKAWIYNQVHGLATRIKARNVPCVWVGPIWGTEAPPAQKTVARVKEMSQFLSQSVAPCTFVDSTGAARPGELVAPDGEHLTASGYRIWGTYVAGRIAQLKTQNALKP